MTKDLERAKALLESGEYTFVSIKNEEINTSTERGLRPLLRFLDARDAADGPLSGASVADKVVGKAPALLYLILGVKELYAPCISYDALTILMGNGISVCFDKKVRRVMNDGKSDVCPMEKLVAEIDDPSEALARIRERVRLD